MTVEGYIKWFLDNMTSRTEPKYFQIEHWSRYKIEKLYQSGLICFIKKFEGHNQDITRDLPHLVSTTYERRYQNQLAIIIL